MLHITVIFMLLMIPLLFPSFLPEELNGRVVAIFSPPAFVFMVHKRNPSSNELTAMYKKKPVHNEVSIDLTKFYAPKEISDHILPPMSKEKLAEMIDFHNYSSSTLVQDQIPGRWGILSGSF